MIPHSRPLFDEQCAQVVGRIVRGGHTARGLVSEALETRGATLTGMRRAAAVDTGSSALMLALYALSLDRSLRRVGIPAYACRAVLHAVHACGAEPVLMDCADDLRLDARQAEALAPSLDAVVLVHPFGMIEPMVDESWTCPVIEDIAQAAGGSFGSRPLGGFGTVSIASFYATKPWGGAYGGMVLSHEDHLVERVCAMRHADTADVSLPYAGNHQLSDVHAALAMYRIDKAEQEKQQRTALAARYDAWLEGAYAQVVRSDAGANHYRYIVRVEDAGQTIAALHSHGVAAARPVDAPLSYLLGQTSPGAETAWRQCVSLPLLAEMSEQDEETMHKTIRLCL